MKDSLFNPYSVSDIKEITSEHGFRFKKSFGQNFLISEHAARAIADFARITDGDRVIEIGTGLLSLTWPLSEKAASLISFEKDNLLFDILQNLAATPKNTTFINGDFLDVEPQDLPDGFRSSVKIVGNLPYSVSSQILLKLFFTKGFAASACFAFQKELAQRITSESGRKSYGTLSVLSHLLAVASTGPKLSPSVFYPRPKIDTYIVRFDFREKPLMDLNDTENFSRFIRTLFSYRRKTLLNALSAGFKNEFKKEAVGNFLGKIGVDGALRLEMISPEEIYSLFLKLKAEYGLYSV